MLQSCAESFRLGIRSYFVLPSAWPDHPLLETLLYRPRPTARGKSLRIAFRVPRHPAWTASLTRQGKYTRTRKSCLWWSHNGSRVMPTAPASSSQAFPMRSRRFLLGPASSTGFHLSAQGLPLAVTSPWYSLATPCLEPWHGSAQHSSSTRDIRQRTIVVPHTTWQDQMAKPSSLGKAKPASLSIFICTTGTAVPARIPAGHSTLGSRSCSSTQDAT